MLQFSLQLGNIFIKYKNSTFKYEYKGISDVLGSACDPTVIIAMCLNCFKNWVKKLVFMFFKLENELCQIWKE